MSKPFCQASDNNKAPILGVLRQVFADRRRVLEIGSGTGQHAVHFAAALGHLNWQPTDLADKLDGIRRWITAKPCPNLASPVELDVMAQWPELSFDAAFSANTAHIMPWLAVEVLFGQLGQRLPMGGVFCLYGPFHRDGQATSEGNARFDAMLRNEPGDMGIRDDRAVLTLAEGSGLRLVKDHAMPANNRLLQFTRV